MIRESRLTVSYRPNYILYLNLNDELESYSNVQSDTILFIIIGITYCII